MALIPGRQLHLDSFQSSLSKFHGAPLRSLQFIRCSSSVSVKTRSLFPNSQKDKIPSRKSSSFRGNRTDSVSLSIVSNWLSGWNKPNKQSRPKPPRVVVDYGDKDSGTGGSGSTMDKIVKKLKKFGYMDGDANENRGNESERMIEKGSVEDIFYVEEGMLPNARGGFSRESPLGVESVFKNDGEVRFPWEKPKRKESEEGLEIWTARRKSKTSLAELTLPESELRRLRNLTWQTKSKTKIGGRGVTQEVVNAIHEKWKTSEIVNVKVEGAAALNMKRLHEMLERRSGGLVIWRSGTAVTLYRGVSYEVPSERALKRYQRSTNSLPPAAGKTGRDFPGVATGGVHAPGANLEASPGAEKNKEIMKSGDVTYEHEIEKLLDGLGPRYTDCPGVDPLPVDADMLPGTVPGYKPPFRMLPYGVRSTLGRKEGTDLRRIARVIPPHFALGRSRQLQGLAMAMIKLWEKSSIAKVALKRGVQLTTSERMAEDIKKLTGGMLLSRNKDFLVFYRGKDFLSSDVAEALLEKERLAKSLQDEEQARLRASAVVMPTNELMEQLGSAGTLEETLDADVKWGVRLDSHHKAKMMRKVEIARHTELVKKLEKKMAFAERRLRRAERALSKVEAHLKPSESRAEPPESITNEERYMFRKLGLRMKAFLLLGRRGLFDGTVENMHLHWKYRELVKVITKARSFEQVKKIALGLERESGGVLVSVDKISKGYAIIVFRGKDYQRPTTLRPKNLLSKRRALARSIEIQRHEALLDHVSALQSKMDKIRFEIENLNNVKIQGDEELYDRLDSTYASDDEQDITEEQDEAYLETYNSENDDFSEDENEIEKTVRDLCPETNFLYNFQNQESVTDDEEDVDQTYSEAHDTEEGEFINDVNSDIFSENLPTKLPSQVTEKNVKSSINGSSD